jgi:CheY-like chemotaxis protein
MAHILVVDDDSSVLRLLTRALPEHTVTALQDGREAILMAQTGAPIDLLLTDYLMPSMTGPEVIGWIREMRPGLRAIIVSSYCDVLDHQNPDWWRLETHVSKPFTVEAIRSAVQAAVMES